MSDFNNYCYAVCDLMDDFTGGVWFISGFDDWCRDYFDAGRTPTDCANYLFGNCDW